MRILHAPEECEVKERRNRLSAIFVPAVAVIVTVVPVFSSVISSAGRWLIDAESGQIHALKIIGTDFGGVGLTTSCAS